MKKEKCKKKIVAMAMVAVLIVSNCNMIHANAESTTMKVNKKTVYISSTISKSGAKASTGSDTNVTVKVKSIYISAKNGKLTTMTTTKKGGNIATVAFVAPSGAVSKSITSTHTASYNGAQHKDTTAASR